MSQNKVTKIRRLIGKLKTMEELSKIVETTGRRQEVLRNRERQRLNEETFQEIKFLKPGDVLIQCKNTESVIRPGTRTISTSYYGIGRAYTVIKVLMRLKEITVQNQHGDYVRFSMDEIRAYGLKANPPKDILALALRNKISLANSND